MAGAPDRAESLRPVLADTTPRAVLLDTLGIREGGVVSAEVLERLAGMVRDAERQRRRSEAAERETEFARQRHEAEIERLTRRCDDLAAAEIAHAERLRLAAVEREEEFRREGERALSREAELTRAHGARLAEVEARRQRSELALADLDARFHAELHNLHLAIDRHAKEAALARAQTGAVAEQLHGILMSASWRAAYPIRFASRVARRGRSFARRLLRR